MANITHATTEGRSPMVTGLFTDLDNAERAYQTIKDRGYTSDDITLMMSDEARRKHFADHPHTELGNKALEGAGTGGAIGTTLGAILGAVAAAGTLAIPGLNIIAAGPIIAALTGAGAGALTGGLLGALIGWGIPEKHAKVYEEGIKKGGIVLGVYPRNEEDAEYFERLFEKNHGQQVYR